LKLARTLAEQATDLEKAMAELVKKYQFRDREETVGYGLSVSQAYALRALRENGGLSMGALAEQMRLSISTMTRVVDQLERKTLVRRVRSPLDRRVCEVATTRRGQTLWDRIEAELVESDLQVLRGLAPSERETAIRAIRLLSRAVDEWRARAAEREA
jgi:DNA-binding MarR family transcriptional regulator